MIIELTCGSQKLSEYFVTFSPKESMLNMILTPQCNGLWLSVPLSAMFTEENVYKRYPGQGTWEVRPSNYFLI